MTETSRINAMLANRVLAAFGILVCVAIGYGTPRGTVVRHEIELKVDPNDASTQVLDALPGLGPARVKAIVEAREEAPFQSVEDLDRRVRGIGPATANALKPFLRFDASKP